jgi:cob(I)alamin adenosyltransferase
MKIYIKSGDRGETGLFGGRRVSKGDWRVESYGANLATTCVPSSCTLHGRTSRVAAARHRQNRADLHAFG